MEKQKRWSIPPKWSELNRGEIGGVEPEAGSWPMFFFKKHMFRGMITLYGEPVSLDPVDPYTIDFKGEQLEIVKQTIRNLTPQQIEMAKLYAETTPTEDWAFVINELLEKYDSNPPRAARITGICKAALNDTMVVTWDIKYSTDIARPDQLDPSLQTVIPTPRFPAYPSAIQQWPVVLKLY